MEILVGILVLMAAFATMELHASYGGYDNKGLWTFFWWSLPVTVLLFLMLTSTTSVSKITAVEKFGKTTEHSAQGVDYTTLDTSFIVCTVTVHTTDTWSADEAEKYNTEFNKRCADINQDEIQALKFDAVNGK